MESTKRAVPHSELISILLDPNVPKSEMEYAAMHEIENLGAKVELLQAELEFLREARAALQTTIKKIRALL